MKKHILFLLLSVMVISCSKNDATSQSELLKQAIQGKWLATASIYYDPTDPLDNFLHPVSGEYILGFNLDGTFTSSFPNPLDTSIQQFKQGRFTISNDSIITLEYIENGQVNDISQKKITLLNTTTLDVTSDIEGACIELCGERYSKQEIEN
jgi:hypothetical protein